MYQRTNLLTTLLHCTDMQSKLWASGYISIAHTITVVLPGERKKNISSEIIGTLEILGILGGSICDTISYLVSSR